MEAHILNGDAMANDFPIGGTCIICREALIEGPVKAAEADDFWHVRASFLSNGMREDYDRYFEEVVPEFEKLKHLEDASAINLWFEHDLFCQANLWFLISYISDFVLTIPSYVVMPPPNGDWSGFGKMRDDDLRRCYNQRIRLSPRDVQLGTMMWNAYRENNFSEMKKLSASESVAFPLMADVVEAHIQRFPENGLGRPNARLKQITKSGVTDFSEIFKQFWHTEGIYGFGDLQVKKMLANL